MARLLGDAGIVRHRGKIEAGDRQCPPEPGSWVASEGSLSSVRVELRAEGHGPRAVPQAVSTSPESTALSKELKRRGWRFVGPTTVYAFMQAMGLVNDHADGCVIRPEVKRSRDHFRPPGEHSPASASLTPPESSKLRGGARPLDGRRNYCAVLGIKGVRPRSREGCV